MDDIVATHVGAVVGFHAPDGQDDLGLDPIALLRPTQRLGPLATHALAVGDPCGRHGIGNILAGCLDRFGLAARKAHNAVGRRKARERLLENGAGHAPGGRFGPDRGHEILHIGECGARENKGRACGQSKRHRSAPRKNGKIDGGGGTTHGGTFSASNRKPSCHAFMAIRCPPPTGQREENLHY